MSVMEIVGKVKETGDTYKNIREFLEALKANPQLKPELKPVVEKILALDIFDKINKIFKKKFESNPRFINFNYEPMKMLKIIAAIISLFTSPFAKNDKPFEVLKELSAYTQQANLENAKVKQAGENLSPQEIANNIIAETKKIRDSFKAKLIESGEDPQAPEHVRTLRILYSDFFNPDGNTIAYNKLWDDQKFVADLKRECEIYNDEETFSPINFFERDNKVNGSKEYQIKCQRSLGLLFSDASLVETIQNFRSHTLSDEHLFIDYELILLPEEIQAIVQPDVIKKASEKILHTAGLSMDEVSMMYPIANFETDHNLGEKVPLDTKDYLNLVAASKDRKNTPAELERIAELEKLYKDTGI